jgi:23S rRNA (cytosine1962-C5)-methyltransferase
LRHSRGAIRGSIGAGTSSAAVLGPSPAARTIEVHLLAGRDKALRDGHPWVFAGAVARVEGPDDSPLARVLDARGRLIGVGFYSPRSQIRVRLLQGGVPDAALAGILGARLDEALALRRAVLPPETTGYRLLNAEGDGVPGWTVDRFGETLVSQITVAGLEAVRGEAYAALAERLPDCAVVQADDLPARHAEGLPAGAGRRDVVRGAPPDEAVFLESGLTFTADLTGGQKTGFYCDQRENRRLAERLAGGRSVLDLFAHTGAFGVYALRGGARQVTHVESAARSIEWGSRHYAMNGLEPGRAEWIKANVWEDLRRREAKYDMVICDPPPLARKRGDLAAAARAYKDLNRLAFGRLAPGGLLLTWSCSGAVDATLFRQILFAAAVEAGVRVALLAQLGAAADHPIALAHPQGEYLKGWLVVVQSQ